MMGRKVIKESEERLGPNEIHIHLFRTDDGIFPNSTAPLLSRLSLDEREQYGRFGLESRKKDFLWSRLLIRGLLAYYLKMETRDLTFGYLDRGKPFLKGSSLQFNLSHTQGLIACSFGREILGLDVEKVDVGIRPQWKLLAGRYFSTAEKDYLFSQPPESQPIVFFRIFILKEAYLKALGTGLDFPLSNFTIPLPLAERSSLSGWEYFTQNLSSGDYCLAHVVESPDTLIHGYLLYDWNCGSLMDFLQKDQAPWPNSSWEADERFGKTVLANSAGFNSTY